MPTTFIRECACGTELNKDNESEQRGVCRKCADDFAKMMLLVPSKPVERTEGARL